MENTSKKLILTTIIFLITVSIFAYPQSKYYEKWRYIDSDKLYEKCSKFSQSRATADSSLIYGTVICNRYSSSSDRQEQMICAKSHIILWYLYYTYYNDYPKAYENILKAEEITKELSVDIPYIDMYLASFYHLLSDLNNDQSLKKIAFIYYKKAFYDTYKIKQKDEFNFTFTNIILIILDKYQDISDEWKLYEGIDDNLKSYVYDYNKQCYNAIMLSNQGNHTEALKIIEELSIPEDAENDGMHGKLEYIKYHIKAKLCEMKGDLISAIESMKNAERISKEHNIREDILAAYDIISDYYLRLNRLKEYKDYRYLYLFLKDSLMGTNKVASISRIKFVRKIDKMNNEITEMKHKKEIQSMFSFLILIVFIITLIASLFMYFKNKQLATKNKTLFNKYSEFCKVEERLRKNAHKEEVKDDITLPDETKQKYVASSLQESNKEIVLERILQVMENSDEIYSPDFNTERLEELTDTRYKYVSQVINETFGCGFNALLNKYRVKEVCRRFADVENYGMYTTEAISESVGFKTRPTFINAFKKETGMTPLQYLKILKSEKEEI